MAWSRTLGRNLARGGLGETRRIVCQKHRTGREHAFSDARRASAGLGLSEPPAYDADTYCPARSGNAYYPEIRK